MGSNPAWREAKQFVKGKPSPLGSYHTVFNFECKLYNNKNNMCFLRMFLCIIYKLFCFYIWNMILEGVVGFLQIGEGS